MTEAASDGSTYTVKSGDTLGKIARAHGTSYKKIMAVNDLKTTAIHVGQKLKMPAAEDRRRGNRFLPPPSASAADAGACFVCVHSRIGRSQLVSNNPGGRQATLGLTPVSGPREMKWATTILIFCVAVLTGLGMVMLYSSSMNMETGKSAVGPSHPAGASFLLSQLVWCFLGLIGCVVAASTDYRRVKKISPWLLGVAAVLLVLVFVPGIGVLRNGGRRWIGFGRLPHFQPSELAKLALVLFLAFYGERYQRQMGGFKKGLLIPGCVAASGAGFDFC